MDDLAKLPAKFVPQTIPEVVRALAAMEREMEAVKTYAEIRRLEREAEAIKALYGHIERVRQKAEWTILVARRRVGEELAKAPDARGAGSGRGKEGVHGTPSFTPTMAEQVGSKQRGRGLKALASVAKAEMKKAAEALWEKGKEATQTAVIKLLAGEQTKARRETSRAARELPDGLALHIGDCRDVLSDVGNESVALVLTDPPYGDEAEPLYRWLGEWSSRVLVPGGSLICYTGQSRLDRDMALLGQHLRYWWLLAMLHDQSQRLPGKFVIAEFKPVLWYVKGHRRGRTLVPDVLRSPARDKSLHDWSQGDGGIAPLIEHLTDPGELIADPFAGTAAWGERAVKMGRRWVGADIAEGGSTKVEAAE